MTPSQEQTIPCCSERTPCNPEKELQSIWKSAGTTEKTRASEGIYRQERLKAGLCFRHCNLFASLNGDCPSKTKICQADNRPGDENTHGRLKKSKDLNFQLYVYLKLGTLSEETFRPMYASNPGKADIATAQYGTSNLFLRKRNLGAWPSFASAYKHRL